MKFFRYLLLLAGGTAFYLIYYITAQTLMRVLPQIILWDGADFSVNVGAHGVSFFDLLYLVAGFIVFMHGLFYLAYVNNYSDSLYTLLEGKEDSPSGPYKSVRHPLYTAFVMIELGLFASVRSVFFIGFVCLLCLIQFLSALVEERFILGKRYESGFAEYKAEVPRRFFTRALGFYMFILMLLTGGGIYSIFHGVE